MRLEGKVAVVTGAASGIGQAVAELFAEQGAIVYATDVRPVKSHSRTRGMEHDVSQNDQWSEVIQRVEKEEGRLSILVNNAGIVGSYDPSLNPAASTNCIVIQIANRQRFY